MWRVVDGLEALGSWLGARGCWEASVWHKIAKANSLFHAKQSLLCDPKGSGQESHTCLLLHVCGCCSAWCWRVGIYAVYVSGVAYLGAGQTQTRFMVAQEDKRDLVWTT